MITDAGTQMKPLSFWGLALTGAVILALEVLLVRILTYTIRMDFVHMVLALAMAGFGIAGTWTTLKGITFPSKENYLHLARWCCYFSISVILCFAVYAKLSSYMDQSFLIPILLSAILLLPFVAGGMVITAALSMAPKQQIGRVYMIDLLGSAIGCLIPFLILRELGAEQLLSTIAATALVSALFFAHDQFSAYKKTFLIACLISALASIPHINRQLFNFSTDSQSHENAFINAASVKNFSFETIYTRWNPVGRITHYLFHDVPDEPEPYPYGFYAQDGTNGALIVSWDGLTASQQSNEKSKSPIPSLCTNSTSAQGYFQHRSKVMIIGVGGGLDIQCALYNEADSIDAIEINPDSLYALENITYEMTGKIASSPKVKLHLRDGRSFAHGAAPGQYDLIQLSGVDTKQMLASGAKAINENILYTQEAFADYLKALDHQNGVLSIIGFTEPFAQRLANTAVISLQQNGVKEPLKHILIHQISWIMYGVLVKNTPFTEKELAAYREYIERNHKNPPENSMVLTDVLLTDMTHPLTPMLYPEGGGTPYMQDYHAAIKSNNLEQYILNEKTYNIRPVTDDSPYIFNLFHYNKPRDFVLSHVKAVIGGLVGITTLAFIFCMMPVLHLRKTISKKTLQTIVWYFTGVGIGFLFIEVWLIHQLSMWLGHQTIAFAIVLASLLLGTGIGSHEGFNIIPDNKSRVMWAVTLLVLMLATLHFSLGFLIEKTWHLDLVPKCILAAGISIIMGLVMGTVFPTGLAWLKEFAAPAVPLAISINFFASVFSTLIIIPITVLMGYSQLLLAAVGLYVMVAVMARRFS